jgi:hypothetical protein
MIVHHWMEPKYKWAAFFGVLGFFGGFVYFAVGGVPAAIMTGILLYPVALACLNRTEIWKDGERVRWKMTPVYCKKAGKVRLEEVTRCWYRKTVRRSNKSSTPSYEVGIDRRNGKRNKLLTGFYLESKAKGYAERLGQMIGKRVERG